MAINNQSMCLQEKYFPYPDKYMPERFMKNTTLFHQPPPYVMLPFGLGSRMCIGRRFAEQEIYLAIIKVKHNLIY
mgnify:CR=1 FL=1